MVRIVITMICNRQVVLLSRGHCLGAQVEGCLCTDGPAHAGEWCSSWLDKCFCEERDTATWFCSYASRFLSFLFRCHPVSSGTFSKRPFMYFGTTWDNGDQAMRKFPLQVLPQLTGDVVSFSSPCL